MSSDSAPNNHPETPQEETYDGSKTPQTGGRDGEASAWPERGGIGRRGRHERDTSDWHLPNMRQTVARGRHERSEEPGNEAAHLEEARGEATQDLWLETPKPREGQVLGDAFCETVAEVAGVPADGEPGGDRFGEGESAEAPGEEGPLEGEGEEKGWWKQDAKPRHLLGAILVVLAFWSGVGAVRTGLNAELPYYVMSAGPAEAAEAYVRIDGLSEESGELHYLTVAVSQATVKRAIEAFFDPELTLEPIREDGPRIGDAEARRTAEEMMRQSQANAIIAALTYLGEEVVYTGEGASIIAVIEGSGAAEAGLEAGEVIIDVDGHPIHMAEDLVAAVEANDDGQQITLRVSDGKSKRPQVREVVATMSSLDLVDTVGDPTGESRVMLGVYVETKNPRLDTKENIEFTITGVGGPSAGMIWALEIIDQKTGGSISRGRVIAGTGTITSDGEVGAVGGVWQKVFGAVDAGAELLIVPKANLAEAEKAAEAAGAEDLPVIGVETLAEAVAALQAGDGDS